MKDGLPRPPSKTQGLGHIEVDSRPGFFSFEKNLLHGLTAVAALKPQLSRQWQWALKEGVPMSKTIHAVFAGGVFRPVRAVDLRDPCEVKLEPRSVSPKTGRPGGDDFLF